MSLPIIPISGYSDGACKGNGKPGFGDGGWGAVLFVPTGGAIFQFVDYGGKKQTTNQVMELEGMLNLLRLCIPSEKNYLLHTDSTYVLGGLIGQTKDGEVTKGTTSAVFKGYLGAWLRNGWKKVDKTPVKNSELWKAIVVECNRLVLAGTVLSFKWIKGHSGDKGNDMADELANLGVPKE
jgi:ribonuclease HI